MRFLGFAFAVLITLELLFSLLSPIVFGNLARQYFARIQAQYPPGASAYAAQWQMTDEGLKVNPQELACLYTTAGGPCIRQSTARLYAGGNPLCSYWLMLRLQTSSRRISSPVRIETSVLSWQLLPERTTCFWEPYSYYGRPAVLIDSIRAELGIR